MACEAATERVPPVPITTASAGLVRLPQVAAATDTDGVELTVHIAGQRRPLGEEATVAGPSIPPTVRVAGLGAAVRVVATTDHHRLQPAVEVDGHPVEGVRQLTPLKPTVIFVVDLTGIPVHQDVLSGAVVEPSAQGLPYTGRDDETDRSVVVRHYPSADYDPYRQHRSHEDADGTREHQRPRNDEQDARDSLDVARTDVQEQVVGRRIDSGIGAGQHGPGCCLCVEHHRGQSEWQSSRSLCFDWLSAKRNNRPAAREISISDRDAINTVCSVDQASQETWHRLDVSQVCSSCQVGDCSL